MPRRTRSNMRRGSSRPSMWLILGMVMICLYIFFTIHDDVSPASSSLLFIWTSSSIQVSSSNLPLIATAKPISLSGTLTDRIFTRPANLELSTEGVLVDGRLTRNMSGSFRYHDDTTTGCSDCIVHFSPVTYNHVDFALVTKSGHKSSGSPILLDWDLGTLPTLPNQDQSLLLYNPQNNHKLLALMDGHGEVGHYASQAVVLDLPFALFEQLEATSTSSNEHGVEYIIRKSFLQVDRGIVSRVTDGGTTAVVVYQNDDTVYLGSAGDSTAFCATYNSRSTRTTILAQAVHHKPGNDIERGRIESHGGTVVMPSKFEQANGASSRVIIPSLDGMSTTALAMSRCFGDEEGKLTQVLIAEPSIVTVPIQPNMFCVAASDGLIDFVPVATVAEAVGKALFDSNRAKKLDSTCQGLIDASVRQWSVATGGTYRDDISIVVSRIS